MKKKKKEILPTIQKTVIDSLKKSPIKEPISVKKDSVKTEKTVLKTPIIQEKTSQKTPKIAEKEPIIVKTFPDIYYIIPSQNIEWEIPFDEGKILIMNKSGQLVHEIILEKGAENRWNGMTTQGFVPAGLYVFYVENGNPTNPLKGKISVQP